MFYNLQRHSHALRQTRILQISWVICIWALSRGCTTFAFKSLLLTQKHSYFRTNSFQFIFLCFARPGHPMLLSELISVRGGGCSFPQPRRVTELHRDRRQSDYSLWLLGLMNSVVHHIMHNMHLLVFFFFCSGGGEPAFPLAFLSVKCGRSSHHWPYFGCRSEGCWCRTSCGFSGPW